MSIQSNSQVWVVDDDPDDHYLIQRMFHQVDPAIGVKPLFDGSELLPSLEKTAFLPKLILLDLNMDRMGGFDALRQVRASSLFQHLVIIILTTSTNAADKEKSIQLGANQFLSKPPRIDDFSVMVKQLADEWAILDPLRAETPEAFP